MLSGILDRVPSLIPKRLLFGAFIPLAVAFVANSAFFYWQDDEVRTFLALYVLEPEEAGQAEIALWVALTILLLALVLSPLNAPGRALLEGRGLPGWLQRPLRARHGTLRRNLREEPLRLLRERDRIRQRVPGWKSLLTRARNTPGSDPPPKPYTRASACHQRVRGAVDRHDRGSLIPMDELEEILDELRIELMQTPFSATGPARAGAALIERDQGAFIELCRAAAEAHDDRAESLLAKANAAYGATELAPTAMGNVALSINSYALRRYGFNSEILWPRLQKVLQGEPFNDVLQNAKNLVDFFVASVFLTAGSTLVWLIYLLAVGYGLGSVLAVGIGGGLAVVSLYRLGVESQRVFAGAVAASIDLYRFDLLAALKMPLPPNRDAEQQLWSIVNRTIAWGEVGDDTNSSYDHGMGVVEEQDTDGAS